MYREKRWQYTSVSRSKRTKQVIKREHFTIPMFQEIVAKLGKLRFFSIVDQSSAFWPVELDEICRDLTTFHTSFGRYRFKRMPFGISSASKVLQKKAFQLFGDIKNVYIIADHMLTVGDTELEHDEASWQFSNERKKTTSSIMKKATV